MAAVAESPPPEPVPADALLLRLDGFEGPLDLLLELARGQKVDLARISILALVEQYLAVIEGARRIRLELAADWLVMAAWLTWLKSRLLLPSGSEAADEAESAAEKNGVEAQDTEDKDGGQNIGWVSNGDSLRFDDVNFGDSPATSLVARVASAVADGVNGRIEIRIDSATSPPVGNLPIGNTGGWQTWRSQATDITAVTGVHAVFLTFAADRGDDFLNLNYIKFTH